MGAEMPPYNKLNNKIKKEIQMFYLKIFRNYIFNFGAFLRNKVIMTNLKLVFLVLIAITIFACESDPVEPKVVDIVWEPAGSLPPPGGNWGITFVNNGNIWLNNYNYSEYKQSLYLSTNNGVTWDEKYSAFENDSIYGISVNPVNGDILRLGVTYDGQYAYHRELMRSTNNGKSWETIIITDTTNVRDLNIRGSIFTASGEIYLGILKIYEYGSGKTWDFCCYYSNDNGNTWVEKSKGLSDIWLTALGKDGTLYARSMNGVYHSTDKGATWLPSSNYNNKWFLSLTTCDDGSIFGTVSNVGIVKSTDKGVNWTELNTGSLFIDGVIVYNSVTKDVFVSTTDNSQIYRSNNLGKDWKLENEGLPVSNEYCYGFDVNPKTGQVFTVTNTGVYRTKNYPK